MAANIAVVYDACVLYPAPLRDLIERYPQQVLQAVDTILARLKNPRQTLDSYLETLANQGLLNSVALLRDLHGQS